MRTAKRLTEQAAAGLLLLSLLGSSELESQRAPAGEDEGAALYREVASSVLWIEAVDASGAVVSTGSGFLVEGGQVLTSAHVVATGTPRVRLGPVALNARVERLDLKQDLAALAVQGQLALPDIPLANNSPAPGTSVWVIGNPQGLERTISAGTTSGTRTENGVSHLQLSAPVSPGSSGGPVLTSDGKVVGLVRMTIQTGQNLNFAVPVESIRGFLAGDTEQKNVGTFQEAIQQLAAMNPLDFQGDTTAKSRACELARSAIAMAGEDKERLLTATSAAWGKLLVPDCLDEHLNWARKTYRLFGVGHDPSFSIFISALMAAGRRADDGTPERAALWAEAVQAFEQERRVRPKATWSFWANLAEAAMNVVDRNETTEKALKTAAALCGDVAVPAEDATRTQSEAAECRRRVGTLGYDHFSKIGNLDEARDGLLVATAARQAPFEEGFWARYFDMLEDRWLALYFRFWEAKRFKDASNAAETAAQLWTELSEWGAAFNAQCRAALSASFANMDDKTLELGRECIALSSKVEDVDTQVLGWVHAQIAEVLQKRGLPEQVLIHTQQAVALLDAEKEAIWLGPAFETRAAALLAMGRPSEALAAAKEALRLTDGTFASTHFAAGAAAFELRDFTTAERYFRKALELDPTDAAAVYNVALCLENRGFREDAAVWYRRYLKLDPGAENRPEVERKLRVWGQ